MSDNNAPWGSSEDGPAALINGLRLHWPHYVQAVLEVSASWSFSAAVHFPDVPNEIDPEIIECVAKDRTDTWEANATGTLVWDRQASADECFGLDLEPGEMNVFADALGDSITPPTPSVPVVIAHSFQLAEGSATIDGTISKTVHTGDACDITATTTEGTFSLSSTPGIAGIYEDALNRWWKFHSPSGGSILDVASSTGPGLPSALPTITAYPATIISGPPEGSDIVFGWSLTLNVPDLGSWHGTATLDITLTLSNA